MWRWWRRRRWNVSVWWWWWRWRRWRWSRTLVVVTVEPDGHAARLVGNGHGVDVVPAVVTRGARPESGVAIVLESAVAGQAETAGWRGTFITLPLRRRRREDAATTVRIRQAAGVDAVLTLRHRQVSLAYAVLSVRKLADAAARTPIGGEMEAAERVSGLTEGWQIGSRKHTRCRCRCAWPRHWTPGPGPGQVSYCAWQEFVSKG